MKKKHLNTKQRTFEKLASKKKEHGGSLSHRKRRSFRPISTKHSLHVTLRSDFAIGGRCLLRHGKMIELTMRKAAFLFRVRIYNYAICGNHLHLFIKGNSRVDLQNFFRVFAGHTAQNILREHPLKPHEKEKRRILYEGGASRKQGRAVPCQKNRRKFWQLLLYSRIVGWGREFKAVFRYVTQNTLEALRIIPYMQRKTVLQRHSKLNSS